MNKKDDLRIVKRTFKGVCIAQFFSFLAQFVAVVVDGVVVGKCLGSDNLAAFGFASPVVSVVTAFVGFAMTGISIICARCLGDTDRKKQESIFTTCMIFALLLGAVLTIIIVVFSSGWAYVAGAKGDVCTLTADYIKGYGLGIIPTVMTASLFPIMQLDGDKNRMTFSFIAMAAVDIILDIVNGFLIHGGIFGMGIATAVSEVVSMLILLGHFIGRDTVFKFRLSSFRVVYVPEIVVLGYMYIVKQLLSALLTFIYNNYLQIMYGGDLVAAYTSIVSAGRLFLCVGMAIGNTVSVLSGVYAGEEDSSSLKKLMRVSFSYSVIVNGILTVLAIIAAAPLISAYFKESGQLLDTAITGFRIYIVVMIFHSINLCLRGYYQSMKLQAITFWFSFLQNFACALAAMFILDNLLGLYGVWISSAAGELLAFLLITVYSMLKGKEKHGFFDKILFIPKEFESTNADTIERTLTSMETVMEFVGVLPKLCGEKGATQKQSNDIALAVEELAGNIIRYGFVDKKEHSIEVRVIKKGDEWLIRLRDDCLKFNPTKYLDTDDSIEHVGIKMIARRAKDFSYMNTLNMNNLVVRV